MTEQIGQHVLLDVEGVEAARLSDATAIEAWLRAAAEAAGAHVLFGHFHPFGPEQGVTGVLLLMESHISIHTWPEHGYAAIDIFMCGEANVQYAVDVLLHVLAPRRHRQRTLARGKGAIAR